MKNYHTLSNISQYGLVVTFALYPYFQVFLYKGYFIVIAATFFILMLAAIGGNRRLPKIPSEAWPFFAFYTLPVVTVLWSLRPSTTLWQGSLMLINLPLYYLAYIGISGTSFQFMKRLVLVVPVALFVAEVIVIARYGTFRPKNDAAMADIVGSLASHSGRLAVVCVPFLLAFRRLGAVRPWHYFSAMLFVVIIVVGSLSRASAVMLIVAVLCTSALLPGKSSTKITWLVGSSVGVAALVALAVIVFGYQDTIGQLVDRFSRSQVTSGNGILSATSGDYDYARAAMYVAGAKLITEHYLIGAGFYTLPFVMTNEYGFGLVAHNILISTLGEMGIAGFVLFCIMMYRYTIGLRRSVKAPKVALNVRCIGVACLVSLGLFVSYSMVEPYMYAYLLPIVLGCSSAVIKTVRVGVNYSAKGNIAVKRIVDM